MPNGMWGDRFTERDGFAWHALAKARLDGDEDKTVSHALKVARADFSVSTKPLYYQDDQGQWRPSDRVAITRQAWEGEPEALFGFATDAYHPLQNTKLAEMMDAFTSKWPCETLGVLDEGKVLFLTLAAGSTEVGGDEIKQFMFAYNSHDGGTAFKINITPVRVVCANTCITGLRQASVTANVIHTKNVEREAQFAINLVASLRKAQADTIQRLRDLTKITISYEQLKYVMQHVYPEREDSATVAALSGAKAAAIELPSETLAKLAGAELNDERDRRIALMKRLDVLNRYEAFNDEFPKMARTGWALYNAVTQYEGHRDGAGTDAQAAKSILMGERGQRMAVAFMAISRLATARA